MSPDRSVLTVAGEASGDRVAAAVATSLGARNVRCFGMGGAASAAAGVDLLCDLRRTTGMGTAEIAARIPALVVSYVRLKRAAVARRPRAAVLVANTEFNVALGRWLRRRGVRVLFVVAPQVWAWRPGRMRKVAHAIDRLAVILPFEEALWRASGVDARYVGHPALDAPPPVRAPMHGDAVRLAILPGSRPAEVRMLARPMLEACATLAKRGTRIDARLMVAPSLDARTRQWLLAAATRFGVAAVDVDPARGAMERLGAFDASLTASGTATLECALSGAPPVVAYRMGSVSAALAKRLVRTEHIALPNVVLGRRCYPELVQDDVSPPKLADAVIGVLGERPRFEQAAAELERKLETNGHGTVAERCCSMIEDWLCT
jgi:lipid-A-disaccharide synthase